MHSLLFSLEMRYGEEVIALQMKSLKGVTHAWYAKGGRRRQDLLTKEKLCDSSFKKKKILKRKICLPRKTLY